MSTTVANLPRYIIKDYGFPACATCKYFIPYVTPTKHFEKKVDIIHSKCRMFGFKDHVSGEIINHFAYICRTDSSMCDKNGYHYVPINPVKCPEEERFV